MIKRGIGFKLTVITSIVLFTAFMGKAVYDGINNYLNEIEAKTLATTNENNNLAKEIEDLFNDADRTLNELLEIINYELSHGKENRERGRLVASLKNSLEKNERLHSLGIFFEPNAFDGKDKEFANKEFYKADGRFIPSAEKNGNGIIIEAVSGIDDASQNVWYTLPMKERKICFFPPYKYERNGNTDILITIGVPIEYKGEILGVINADINVVFLQKTLENLPATSKENFKAVISSDGTIVANGIDKSQTMKKLLNLNGDLRENFNEVMQNKISQKTCISSSTGKNSKFIFVPVKINKLNENWAVLSVTSIDMFVVSAKKSSITAGLQYVVILISVVLLLFILIRRSITKPLQFTTRALKNIAQGEGDLTVKLPVKGRDEIAELSAYFNLTISKIRKTIKSVLQNSDLMNDIGDELAENMSETATAVNQISTNIESVNQQMTAQSSNVTETAATMEEIIHAIRNLNRSIESQASSVIQSSAAIEQMVANIASITQTLINSDNAITNLANATEDGKVTISASNSITQKISEASGSLLEASSVIQHIASQTNLLAMNAAIEAAHAGESGKGFAVVADEIRKLAEESSVQGKTITSTLKNLTSDIEVLSNSSKTVEDKFNIIFKFSENVKQTSSILMDAMKGQESGSKEVLTAIRNINNATLEIKDSSAEMLRGGEQAINSMRKLDQLTQLITERIKEMATGAVQINNSIAEVNSITQKNKTGIKNLSAEVKKFKV